MKKVLGIIAAGALALVTAACQLAIQPGSNDTGLGLKAIRVSGSELELAIDPAQTSYEAFANADTVSLAVEAEDPNASVSFNRSDLGALSLQSGRCEITATVTSPGGNHSKSYSIVIYRCVASATLTTLDSINGSPVSSDGLSYRVYRFGRLVGYLHPRQNPSGVYLLANTAFRLVAHVNGRAESALEDVVASADGAQYTFYAQNLGMASFSAKAPSISSVALTSAADPVNAGESAWLSLSRNGELNLGAATAMRVEAESGSEMDDSSWSGFGIKIGIDSMPSVFNGLSPSSSTSRYNAASGRFTTTAIFDIAGFALTPGPHTLTVVGYDRVNNRVEKTLPFRSVGGIPAGASVDGARFASLSADLRSYGVSRQYFSLAGGLSASAGTSAPAATSGSSYRISLGFKLLDASGAPLPILGFKVLRSTDQGASWAETGRMNYGGAYAGTGGSHSWFDTAPDWAAKPQAQLKVVAFTGTEAELASAALPVRLLPAFTAALVAPADGTRSLAFDQAAQIGPDFSFRLSNPALWDPNAADWFYFAPLIKDKAGQIVYYGEFRYSLAQASLQFRYGNDFYDISENFGIPAADCLGFARGLVTLKSVLFFIPYTNLWNLSPLQLQSGIAYEWDIFGSYNPGAGNLGSPSAMNPAYFSAATPGCLARSYADAYQFGNQTTNGWFDFIVR